ncbi:microcephalin isoform X2 [Betta splendens]|uniref:Microcephalin isoform X2 n=1 Tax=Betta splendens TaxID=158456 RepID=A0A6P7Q741_BETSP|nr:microcephalin isoform X2 [Betta splendens]
MTTSSTQAQARNLSVLKDVVAYVDVWSSDKAANYSKPFVQQLQEMGAQVSKTFNKQVTHVIFSNGHPATWRKATKRDVRLVSVLWVGRCYNDGVHADEELYPALNDESNPVLKNKKHRCMQPKDSPERTPENDRRMRKKLDKMMKDLAPKQPLDVSPIIIDEDNGIVYSPGLKRSNYMAQRLKDMREKHENLSPTASQMIESCSPTGVKPSLGNTPTLFKLLYDQSDDDSCASVAEPGYSPHEEGRTPVNHLEQGGKNEKPSHASSESQHQESQFAVMDPSASVTVMAKGRRQSTLSFTSTSTKNSQPVRKRRGPSSVQPTTTEANTAMEVQKKPWLSPCHDVPKQISSPMKYPDLTDNEDEKGNRQQMSRRTPVCKRKATKDKVSSLLEIPSQDKRSEVSKRRSRIKSLSPSPNKHRKGKHVSSDAINSSSVLRSPVFGDAAAELPKDTAAPSSKMKQKTPKSSSTLVKSFSLSGGLNSVTLHSADADDDEFEDYFSPANHHQRSKRPLLTNLDVKEIDIQIPFELEPVPKRKKTRSSISVGSENMTLMTSKLKEKQSVEDLNQLSNASSESPCAVADPSVSATVVAKGRRQSTLPFTSTSTKTEAVKKRRASSSVQPTLTEANTVTEVKKRSVSVIPHTLESRGNEGTVAAGLNEISSQAEANHNKQEHCSLQNMVNKTKAVRTLVMTSMPTEKQHTIVQVVKALGGFSIVDRVCESTTHVVSGSQRRTVNILLGIARGCWILSFEWILWCLEQRQWIPEEPYELSDQFPAAQICRLQRHLSAGEHQQDLFQDQPVIFVSQHSQPPTESLVELIKLCGGTVCKSVRQAGICVGKYNGRRPEGNRILSEQWVLDSITHLKKLPYDNYDLE